MRVLDFRGQELARYEQEVEGLQMASPLRSIERAAGDDGRLRVSVGLQQVGADLAPFSLEIVQGETLHLIESWDRLTIVQETLFASTDALDFEVTLQDRRPVHVRILDRDEGTAEVDLAVQPIR